MTDFTVYVKDATTQSPLSGVYVTLRCPFGGSHVGFSGTTDGAGATIISTAGTLYPDSWVAERSGYVTKNGSGTPSTIFLVPNVVPPTYSNVTITITGQGSTDPTPGEHTYQLGTNLYVIATPATDWNYIYMKRNGVYHTNAYRGEFLNLTSTENIEVVFEPKPTVPPPGNGNGNGETPTGVPAWVIAGVIGGILIVAFMALRKK